MESIMHDTMSNESDNIMLGILCVLASRRAPADISEADRIHQNCSLVVDIRAQMQLYADVRLLKLTDTLLTYDCSITIPCITTKNAELEALLILHNEFNIRKDTHGNSLLNECHVRWRRIELVKTELTHISIKERAVRYTNKKRKSSVAFSITCPFHRT
jgi:hypothetical protein